MTGPLPNWLAAWLGREQGVTSGEAATWRIDFVWLWPPWLTVVAICAAVAWVVFCYAHEHSTAVAGYRALLAAIRLTVVATLGVMLSQIAITLQTTGPPAMALIIDRSASMQIADHYDDSQMQQRLTDRLQRANLGEVSRLNLAKLLITENDKQLLTQFVENYRLQTYFAADGIERVPVDNLSTLSAAVSDLSADSPGSGATRVGDAIRHVLDDNRSAPPAGIVLFSDGVVTAGSSLADAAQEARARGAPLFLVGLGSDRAPRDMEVADVLVDDAVFINDVVSFIVQIKSTGLSGESARVVLRRDDQPSPLADQTVTLGPDDEPQTVILTDRPTGAGEVRYTVEVSPRDDETNRDNNRQMRLVVVREDKIRVLLAFGYPSYEFRFLKTMLERDSTLQVATFLQDADPNYAEQDRTALRTFPISRDELFQFDVLILGDLDPRLLPRSAWPSVKEFVVEKGGGAVFVAGPHYLPWMYRDVPDVAALLPFDFDAVDMSSRALPDDVARGYVVRPTPLGLRLPPLQLGDTPAETEQIWRNLSPLYWLVPLDRLKPAAQVLAEHPTHTTSQGRHLPVIMSQFVGAGKVLFHATDSTWRWRIGVGDAYFSRYWVQAVRYLARGKLTGRQGAELTTDRREYHRGESVNLRLRFLDQRLAPSDDEAVVLVQVAGRANERVALRRSPAGGVFEGMLVASTDGEYELMVTEPQLPGKATTARFTVAAPLGEMARTQMDRAALTAAAEMTHGKFYTIADADRLAEELPRGHRVPIANSRPLELWNRWWLLSLFLALLTTEWVLRKRGGML